MTKEEELNLIKKERDEMEKHMNDMFDLAFMLNNRNDVMNPQLHYEKLSRMVTHYMGSIQQSYGYMSDKAIEALEQELVALEQEPVIEPLERLAESASKTAKVLERLKEQELKWISVSERLPEDEQRVFVTQTVGERTVVYCTRFPFEEAKEKYIIAWMPLPEPYKAEGSDKE